MSAVINPRGNIRKFNTKRSDRYRVLVDDVEYEFIGPGDFGAMRARRMDLVNKQIQGIRGNEDADWTKSDLELLDQLTTEFLQLVCPTMPENTVKMLTEIQKQDMLDGWTAHLGEYARQRDADIAGKNPPATEPLQPLRQKGPQDEVVGGLSVVRTDETPPDDE